MRFVKIKPTPSEKAPTISEEEKNEQSLRKKRENSRKYYWGHREEQLKKQKERREKQKSRVPITAKKRMTEYERKKLTAERTRALWQGRQGQAIKAWKEAKKITYEQMAEVVNVATKTLISWAYEANTANWEKLEKIGIKRPNIEENTDERHGTIDKPS